MELISFRLMSFGLILLPLEGMTQTEASLPGQVHTILERKCLACHGAPEEKIYAEFGYILDRDQLIEKGMIVPFVPTQGRLFQKLINHEMPPSLEWQKRHRPDKTPINPILDEEVEVIRRWVELGVAPWEGEPTPNLMQSTGTLTELETLSHVMDDLRKIPASQRLATRYFSLASQMNSHNDVEIARTLEALTKTMNVTSTRPEIIHPRALPSAPWIYRVNLVQLGWTLEAWTSLRGTYPYLKIANLPTLCGRGLSMDRICDQAVRSTVRADWFITKITKPPFYFQFLRAPISLDFFDVRGVTADSINPSVFPEWAPPMRAGFSASNVELHTNRVYERRSTLRPRGGYLYRSFNFEQNTNEGNIFNYPLGPGFGVRTFKNIATDVIYTLPNGLHAYATFDADRKRIDDDVTGIRCFTCHSVGIIPRDDEIRNAVLAQAPSYSYAEVERVLQLYVEAPLMQAQIQKDNELFLEAIQKLNLKTPGEPINYVVQNYRNALTPQELAIEIGTSLDSLKDSVSLDPILSRTLSALYGNGRLERDLVESVSPTLLQLSALPPEMKQANTMNVEIPSQVGPAQNQIALTFRAARQGRLMALRTLLNSGVSPDSQDSLGVPLIVTAVDFNQVEVIRCLVDEYHVNINATDFRGRRAFEIAKAKNNHEMIELLNQK